MSKNSKHNQCLRVLAYIVCVCLLYENCVYAQSINLNFKTGNNKNAFTTQKVIENLPAIDINNLTIPQTLGSIDDCFKGTSEKTIIHIRDSHVNYEAQVNYSKIIQELLKSYLPEEKKIIGLEGASGGLTVKLFRTIPNEKVKKIVSNYFLKCGYLNGAEYTAIFSQEELPLYGVEDADLYRKNLSIFKEAQNRKDMLIKILGAIEQDFEQIIPLVYKNNAYDFFMCLKSYDLHKSSVVEHIYTFSKYAETCRVDLMQYPFLYASICALKLEKMIDINKVELEREAAIGELRSILTREEEQSLIKQSVLYRLGKVSTPNFYIFLGDYIHKSGIRKGKYSELSRYIRLNSIYRDIVPDKLFKEMENVESELKAKIYVNDNQKECDKIQKNINVIRNLSMLQLSRDDYEYYTQNKSECSIRFIQSEVKKLSAVYKREQIEFYDDKNLSLKVFESFYDLALKRDKAIIDKMMSEMERKQVKVGILITGGFHTSGIKEDLKDKNISYIVASPAITKVSKNDMYLNIMMGDNSPFEKMLMHTGKRLSPPCSVTVPVGGVYLGDDKERPGRLTRLLVELGIGISGIINGRRGDIAAEAFIAQWKESAGDLIQADSDIGSSDGIVWHSFVHNGQTFYTLIGSDKKSQDRLRDMLSNKTNVTAEEIEIEKGQKVTVWFVPKTDITALMPGYPYKLFPIVKLQPTTPLKATSGIKRKVEAGQEAVEIVSMTFDERGDFVSEGITTAVIGEYTVIISGDAVVLENKDGEKKYYGIGELRYVPRREYGVREISIVTGNRELMAIEEGKLVIDLDVLEANERGELKSRELLQMELAEELGHVSRIAIVGSANTNTEFYAIDEIWTDIEKIVMFSNYSPEKQAQILSFLMADNDIDDKEFALVLAAGLTRAQLDTVIRWTDETTSARLQKITPRPDNIDLLQYYVALAKEYGSKDGVYREDIQKYISGIGNVELEQKIKDLQELLLRQLLARGHLGVMYIAGEFCYGITQSEGGYWCSSKNARLIFDRNERVTVITPGFGEMVWFLDEGKYDERLQLGIYSAYRFSGEIEAERIVQEGLGPVVRNIGYERMIQLFSDRENGSLKDKGERTTASVTRNFKWARSADFPGSPYDSSKFGQYVFVIFPREGLSFKPVIRSSAFHRPDLGEAEEYITEDSIGYNDALLIKDESEYNKLKDRVGIDRKTALEILGRTEEEQQAFEDKVCEEALTKTGKEIPGRAQAIAKIKTRMQKAREAGKYNVGIVAMEMPLTDKHGKRLISKGGRGGGQGVYMEDVPWAIAQKGIGSFAFKPLFSEDVMATYGTLDKFLAAYDGVDLMGVSIPVGASTIDLSVIYIEQEGVPVLLLYDRNGRFFTELYSDPDSLRGYIEAVILPRASLVIAEKLGVQFEAYHFNDWQTALGPIFLKELYKHEKWPLGFAPSVLFTTHNLEYQGLFPGYMTLNRNDAFVKYLLADEVLRVNENAYIEGDNIKVDLFALTGLRKEVQYDTNNGLEFWSRYYGGEIPGRHNLMKGAFLYADKVVFVSEGHLREALTEKRGYGLDGVLRTLQGKLSAVYNGIRAGKHSPLNIPALKEEGFMPAPVDGNLLGWKEHNKKALQDKLMFDSTNPKNFVLAVVTRIVKQKGLNVLFTPIADGRLLIDALLSISDPEMGARLQLFIQGTAGDVRGEAVVAKLKEIAKDPKYQGNFRFEDKFDRTLAKQAGAGAEAGLMPSIDEPGGLANQEMALLLTALVVTNRGGLNDFYAMGGTPVKPVSGFEIDDDSESVAERTRSAQEIYDAVKDLFNMYVHRPEEYKRLLAALASFNPDWGERLDQYDNAYTEAVNEKRRQAGLPAVGKKPAETGIGQISADSARELAKIKLRQLIESKGGRITYAEFMENVLFNRDYGYYGAGVVQFGGKISDSVSFGTDSLNPRFAEGMAKQFYNMWESMDKPTVFDLVEMGAGDGTLCLNVLNEIQSKMPDLYGAVRYTIVEVSSSLIKRQSEKISAVHKNVIWKLHSANEEMFKEGELTGVVFSNELVDEFTAHRVVYDEKTNKLQEIYVGFDLARGGFYEVKGDITDRGVIEYMQTIYDETGRHPEPGVEVAVCPQMKDWARNTAKALNKGYIVTFDYGYFYWEGEGQLLTARGLSVYNKGNPVNALLFASDLTHYVDFRMLGVYGEENGLHTEFAGNTSNYMSGFVPGFSSPYGTDVLIQSKGVFSGAVVGILERLKGKIEKSALPNMSLEGDMDVNRVIDDMIAIARKSDKNAEEVLFNVLAKGDNLEQKITQVISEAGLDNSIVKHSLDSVIWKAGKVRQTEEMASGLLAGAPVKGLDVGVIDAHALVGMREDELRRVIGVLTSDVNKALAVVVFDNEDEAVANALTGFNVTIVRANEIGEMLPEEAAVDKVKRERFAGQDIEISNVSVLASLENIVKGRWRVALSRFHYIVLNNKSLTNTALLNMYKELPADIKGYLARTGLSVETIQRATLQEEKFEPEKYDQTAIIEIGKAA